MATFPINNSVLERKKGDPSHPIVWLDKDLQAKSIGFAKFTPLDHTATMYVKSYKIEWDMKALQKEFRKGYRRSFWFAILKAFNLHKR